MDVVTSGTMIPETSATAEGDLGRTPFAHLMVYALDRCLTGALFLTEATGTTHAVRLERGVPVKVRPGDDHALLGAILVERGAVTEEALARALASKGRLGDVLLLADDVEPDALATALDEQFMRRMVRLYALGPDTVYRYYDGHVELADWGEAAEVDPLAQLWAGLREHADASTKLEATLERLGATPLAVRADATLDRFGFAGPDGEAVELVRANAIALPDLCAYDAASPELLRRLVYALVITRQLDLGGGAPVSDSTEAAAAEAPADEPAPKAPIGVARVALKRVKRAVAAAPDLPGDGERAAISPRASRRRDASSSPDSGPVSERRLEDEGAPVSGRLGEGERPPASGRRTEDGRSPSSGRRTEDEGPSPSRADAADPATRARPASSAPPADAEIAAADAAQPSAAVPAEAPSVGLAGYDEPASGLRIAVDPLLPVAELLRAAEEKLQMKDVAAALELAERAYAKEPDSSDAAALRALARLQLPGADAKALAVELDERVTDDRPHLRARHARALLRRRLGDDAGAMRDLRRVLELDPGHADAARELAVLESRQAAPGGLLSRLFRR